MEGGSLSTAFCTFARGSYSALSPNVQALAPRTHPFDQWLPHVGGPWRAERHGAVAGIHPPRATKLPGMNHIPQQTVVTLDLEGVLIPEIWIAVAERTGIEGLRRTTRDEPDYDVLMRYRLDLLATHGLTMPLIQDVIAGLTPLDGAKAFLDALRRRTQVIILSDTFEQFAQPFMRQLGWPTILCHQLVIDGERIADYQLRQPDQKRHAVQALRSLNYRVVAAGDSYNDTAMLGAAHAGFLFHAPPNVIAEFPQFPALTGFDDLLAAIEGALAS